MEDDRVQVDLGIAADIEEAHVSSKITQKQPKKRFIGRRTADASATTGETGSSTQDAGAVQGNVSAT
jgi:2-(3-amino-3-carboxypropyl)histidine synthase